MNMKSLEESMRELGRSYPISEDEISQRRRQVEVIRSRILRASKYIFWGLAICVGASYSVRWVHNYELRRAAVKKAESIKALDQIRAGNSELDNILIDGDVDEKEFGDINQLYESFSAKSREFSKEVLKDPYETLLGRIRLARRLYHSVKTLDKIAEAIGDIDEELQKMKAGQFQKQETKARKMQEQKSGSSMSPDASQGIAAGYTDDDDVINVQSSSQEVRQPDTSGNSSQANQRIDEQKTEYYSDEIAALDTLRDNKDYAALQKRIKEIGNEILNDSFRSRDKFQKMLWDYSYLEKVSIGPVYETKDVDRGHWETTYVPPKYSQPVQSTGETLIKLPPKFLGAIIGQFLPYKERKQLYDGMSRVIDGRVMVKKGYTKREWIPDIHQAVVKKFYTKEYRVYPYREKREIVSSVPVP